MFALGIAIGIVIGAFIGIVIMALMASASYNSEDNFSSLNNNYLTEFSDEITPTDSKKDDDR